MVLNLVRVHGVPPIWWLMVSVKMSMQSYMSASLLSNTLPKYLPN